jgi:hypothetical protein
MSAITDEPPTLERPALSKAPGPVQLRTAHDYALTVQALESRALELTKLAKKNEDEHYHREARTVQADAAAITEIILPRFRPQGELPLATTEQLRAGIANALRSVVRRELLRNAEETPVGERPLIDIPGRESAALEVFAAQIEGYAIDLAEHAFNAGYAARNDEPLALALASIGSLQGAVFE